VSSWQRAIAGVLCASALATGASADEGAFSVSLGANYMSGDYGTANTTNMWYLPATFRYRTDRGLVRLTVPYISVTGNGTVVPVGGNHHVIGPGPVTTRRVTESGLGDVVVGGTYYLVPQTTSRPAIDLTGRIKLGTADEDKNLGTGENDYSVQLDLAKTRDRMLFFGSAGYKLLGDPPAFDLDNILYGDVGGQWRLDAQRNVGLDLYLAESPTAAGSSAAELTAYLNRKLDVKRSLQFSGLVGLSDGSPDWGVGIAISFRQ
jgi:hypothetical protein